MMNLNTRLKSAVLAVGMIISSGSFYSQATANEFGVLMGDFGQFLSDHKIVSFLALMAVIGEVRIMTRSRVEYDYSNWREDVMNLLNSYNIFDAKSRATIMAFFDKYWAGAIVKLDDTTTRTKLEDGAIFTIKGKKLTQKPSGVMGYVDAYVLQQMKKIAELIPAVAAMYVLVIDPMSHMNFHCNKAK